MLANGCLEMTDRRGRNTHINPEGHSTMLFGRLLPIVSPLDNFVINHLIYGFTVEGIEYGQGEGRTQDAAGDNAATKALSALHDLYGNTGN
jgi:hypothetical protein